MKTKSYVILLSVMIVICITNNVQGTLFNNNNIGIKGFSMGNALTGIADDASAVYYNPGGLGLLEAQSIEYEIYSYHMKTVFHLHDNGLDNRSDKTHFNHGGFISKTFEKVAFGFGAYVPYGGSGYEFHNFLGSGGSTEDFAFTLYAFNSAVAFKINNEFSAGMGVSFYRGWFDSIIENGTRSYDGHAGHNFNVGMIYRTSHNFSIGFTYFTGFTSEMDGYVESFGVNVDSTQSIDIPQSYMAGIGYKPNQKLAAAISIRYTLWSEMDSLKINSEIISMEIPWYYKDSLIVGVGLEYIMNSRFTLRSGLNYSQGITKAHHMTYFNIELDCITPAIGIAWNMNDYVEVNLAGFYSFALEETIDSVKYDSSQYGFLLGLRFKYYPN